eukprot:359517-Chlamydomonas_euryale.AAC.30
MGWLRTARGRPPARFHLRQCPARCLTPPCLAALNTRIPLVGPLPVTLTLTLTVWPVISGRAA